MIMDSVKEVDQRKDGQTRIKEDCTAENWVSTTRDAYEIDHCSDRTSKPVVIEAVASPKY